MVQTKKRVMLSPAEEIAAIGKSLGHGILLDDSPLYWLDTGQPMLHDVFGSKTHGIPYGKVTEISGYESHGKTALMLELAAYAQRDGAVVAIWDQEKSWDPAWSKARGLDPENVYVFRPHVGLFGKEKEPRLITAQESATEVELWMKRRHREKPKGRLFVGVDSVAAILPEDRLVSMEDLNMRSKLALSSFLSDMLPRWVGYAAAFNIMIVMVNQLRKAPNVMYGDPTYTPGGAAVRYYSSVRVRVFRKGPKILKGNSQVGFRGIVANTKNKAGEGSQEGAKVGFHLYFDGVSKYVPESTIVSELRSERE